MDKILAIVVLVVVILIAIPHLKAGEWLAPTAIDPQSWITDPSSLALTRADIEANATPPEGYCWFHFDFWAHSPYDSRPVQKGDFKVRL